MHRRHAGLGWLTPNEKQLAAVPPMALAVEDKPPGAVRVADRRRRFAASRG